MLDSYREATEKLERLKTDKFAFTTDSEIDPATRAAEIEKKIIRAQKYTISQETKNAMLVSPLQMDSVDLDDNANLQKEFSAGGETSSDSSIDDRKKPRKHRPKFQIKASVHAHMSPPKKNSSVELSTNEKQIPKILHNQVHKDIQNYKSSEHKTDKSGIKKAKKEGGT